MFQAAEIISITRAAPRPRPRHVGRVGGGQVIDLSVRGALRRRHVGGDGEALMAAMAAANGGCATPGRTVPGFGVVPDECVQKNCRDQHFSINALNLGAGGAITIQAQPQVTMYVNDLIATTSGTFGFLLSDLFVNNEPQWVRNSAFHSDSFTAVGPNTKLKGDGIIPGSIVEITITNLDALLAQSCFLRFTGPAA